MTILVTIGTTNWRSGSVPAAGEVAYEGDFYYAADGITPHMLWDAGLNNIRQMTQAEIDALPAQLATAKAIAEKAAASEGIDKGDAVAGDKVERLASAVAGVALDAFNRDRECMDAMRAAVAAATTLADLKTRFAAISWPAQVTAPQLVTAIKAKIAASAE